MMEEVIDWDNLFIFDEETKNQVTDDVVSESPVFTSIGEVENILMNDIEVNAKYPEFDQKFFDDFVADIFVDSPPPEAASDGDKDSCVLSDKGSGGSPSEEEKDKEEDEEVNEDDPVAKKLKRQLRNRDAAVRSRERKKMYVKDLEMKSRYLEGECRRLGRLLHCVIADNQALRLALGNSALGVTSAKQESAVLLLESLLLGSLLWFVGIIMCLFNLPTLPQSILEAGPPENVGGRVLNEVAPRGERSKMFISPLAPSFVTTRRCKASRTRMRSRFYGFVCWCKRCLFEPFSFRSVFG